MAIGQINGVFIYLRQNTSALIGNFFPIVNIPFDEGKGLMIDEFIKLNKINVL